MAKRRESAEAVFAALFKAQEAASAAARASGTAPTLFRPVQMSALTSHMGTATVLHCSVPV